MEPAWPPSVPKPPSAPPLPPQPPAPPLAPPAPPNNVRTVAGPMALLFGLGVAIIMSQTFRRQMGDVACAWRVSYAPAGRAFAIWGLIFAWMLASAVEQLLVAVDFEGLYVAEPWNNMLMGMGLFMAGLWVVVFGCSRRNDRRAGLVISAGFLLASTWCAVGACAQERAWRSLGAMRLLFVGVPYALFAGWMLVASALGLGTAWLAIRYPPDNRCYKETATYTMLWEEDPVDASGCGGWVPLLLAVPVAAGAALLPDPIIPVPLLWGIFHMRGHFKNRLAIGLLVAGSVAAVAVAAADAWLGAV